MKWEHSYCAPSLWNTEYSTLIKEKILSRITDEDMLISWE